MDWNQILGPIIQLLDTIFIYINSMIYDFISFVYQIFIALAGAKIFNSSTYQEIANRVYVIIGVVSLFLISYLLLKAIIDPDGASKGEYSAKKIIPNVIKVVLFIGLTPVVFSMAYKLQDVIVSTNVIPKIILNNDFGKIKIGDETVESSYSYEANGRILADGIFTSFMSPKDGVDPSEIEINKCFFAAPDCSGIGNGEENSTVFTSVQLGEMIYQYGFSQELIDELMKIGSEDSSNAYTFEMATAEVKLGTKNFQVYANFGNKMHGEKKEIEYNPVLQLLTGIIVLYVLINYCIDLGVRAIKLGYYQIIAPIPILTILIPGQSKVFSNWLKSTISTFLDLFFRLAILFLGLFAITNLPDLNNAWADSLFASNPSIERFAKVFLIIGILIFIKQAPKLLSDLFGIQGSGFKLGIKDKLSEMAGVGGATKSGLESVQGAVTGGLGAGWSAKRNGMNFRDGFKYGMYNGWKGKGNQFNAQRQGIYSKAFDGDGKAAFFGPGRAYFDKKGAQVNKETKNAYRDQNFKRMLAYENGEEFQNEYRTTYNKQVTEVQTKLASIQGNRDDREQKYTDEINDIKTKIAGAEVAEKELLAKQATYAKEEKAFEDNKQKEKQVLQTEYERAKEKGDSIAQLAYASQIKQKDEEKYSNPTLSAEINNLKVKSDNKINLQAQLQEAQDRFNNDVKIAEYDKQLDELNTRQANLDDEYDYFFSQGKYVGKSRTYSTETKRDDFYALKDARSSFERTHADYHDVYRTHAKNLAEESNQAYIHSKEGQRQSAVFREAMKNSGGGGGSGDKK